MNYIFKYGLIILLTFTVAACSDDGGGVTGNPDFFLQSLPEELPDTTHQSEIAWYSEVVGDDVTYINIYNELTGESAVVDITSKERCYDVLWLIFIIIPVEPFCLSDYSYSTTIPLAIGVNNITVSAVNNDGDETVKTYTVERVDIPGIDEMEPNNDYYDAQVVYAPTAISGMVSVRDPDDRYDTYLFTADESRQYTVVTTGVDGYPGFSIQDADLGLIAESASDNYFFTGRYVGAYYVNFWLETGQQAYVSVCCNDSYLLGIY